MLSGAATFWASRATRGSDGRYHIDDVTGPDEENPNVNDEVYTNVGAKTTLEDAVQAAQMLGIARPGMLVADRRRPRRFPRQRAEHPPRVLGLRRPARQAGRRDAAPVPVGLPDAANVAQGDINYYVPRTDPGGPSMSDAVNSIDTSALGTAGCASYVYTERSYQPFIRDVFDQFSETETGGAFTFMTGIGGFLQEFLYGYSGMRWNTGTVALSPEPHRPARRHRAARRAVARPRVHGVDRPAARRP